MCICRKMQFFVIDWLFNFPEYCVWKRFQGNSPNPLKEEINKLNVFYYEIIK